METNLGFKVGDKILINGIVISRVVDISVDMLLLEWALNSVVDRAWVHQGYVCAVKPNESGVVWDVSTKHMINEL